MAEQHLAVRHRNHIVVEYAEIDNVWVLPGKDNLMRIHLVKTRHRFTGLAGLPRRIAHRTRVDALFTPIDKQLNARRAIITAEPVMVGSAFIPQQRHLRQRVVHCEKLRVAEDGPQQRRRGRRLQRAVKFVVQVRHRQMHFAVKRVR